MAKKISKSESMEAVPTELPEDWVSVPFERSVLKERPKVRKIKSSDYLPFGAIPIIDQGQGFIAGYADDGAGVYDGTLPVIIFGDHTRTFKYVDFPFLAGADGTQILIPNRREFDPRFLYYALSALDIPNRGYNRHFSLLKQKHLPKPALWEQQAIAHVLRTVQQAKEATEKVIAATRQFKRSLMKHLFTYGPVPFDQADKVELKETEMGPVPKHWELQSPSKLFKLSSGASRPKELKAEATDNCEFPVYGGNGVMGFANQYFTEFETLVLGRVGEYCGAVHLAPVKSWISDNALYTKEFHRKVNLCYLKAAFEMLDLNRLKKKSGQPLITQSIVNSQQVPLPDDNTIDDIVKVITTVDRKLDSEIKRRDSLDTIFRSLLHHLMTGKVRVPIDTDQLTAEAI